jgi:hypothetical protein
MGLLFDGPSYEEMLAAAERINAARRRAAQQRSEVVTSKPPQPVIERPRARPRPYLIWVNPRPPRKRVR